MAPTRLVLSTSLLLLFHSLLPLSSAQSYLQSAPIVNVSLPPSTPSYSLDLRLSSSPSVTLITSSAAILTAHQANSSSVYSVSYGPTSFLLLPVGASLSPSICTSPCDALLTLTPTTAPLTYSLYYIPVLPLNTAFSLSLPPSDWQYFAYPASASAAPVNVSLSSTTPTSFYLSSSCHLSTFLFPTPTPSSHSSSALLPPGCLSVFGFSSSLGGTFNLSLTPSTPPSVSQPSTGGNGGLSIDASEAFVLAITVVVVALPLLLLCCMLARSIQHKRRMLRDSQNAGRASEAELHRQWQISMEGSAMVLGTQALALQPHGLTEAEIAAMPVAFWRREGEVVEGEGEERCAICLDEFDTQAVVKSMRCGHTLHRDCLDQWLRGSRQCPLCLQRYEDARNVKRPSIAIVGAEVEMVGRGKAEEGGDKDVELPLRIHAAPVEAVVAASVMAASRPVGGVRDEECESCSGSHPPTPMRVDEETSHAYVYRPEE